MKKKKSPKGQKIINPTKEKITPKTPVTNGQSESIMAFYLKALILGVLIFAGIYYSLIYGYIDVQKADKVAKKINAKQKTTLDEKELLRDFQRYQKTTNYKLFHNYKWVYHTLLMKNLDIIAKSDTFSSDKIQAYKSGADFNYLRIIRNATPEDAVILMPDEKDMKKPDNAPANTPNLKLVLQKAYCTYFLYPRTLVYDERDGQDSINNKKNMGKDPDYEEKRKKVTHVAILFGNGYEHLNYNVTQRTYYACLPINKEPQNVNPGQ